MSVLEIKAIKTEIGYFVQRNNPGYRTNSELEQYLFDGEAPEKTFALNWVKISQEPKQITRNRSPRSVYSDFILKDPSLESEQIPASLPYKGESFGETYSDSPYKNLASLYESTWKSVEQEPEVIDFKFEVCLEIDELKEYSEFSYPARLKVNYDTKLGEITANSLKHDLIDTILYPGIVLPRCTSRLTSEQTYQIIREHIRRNIDPKYAKITSDYDFCFEVKKSIRLCETVPYQVDVSSFKAKKPKYETRYRTHREVKSFEMTWDTAHHGRPYDRYTPVVPFEGKNIEDLKEKIDSFLKSLMEKINAPIIDCPHCTGKGVIEEK